MEGTIFLAPSPTAAEACRYTVLDGSFRALGGWPQGAKRGTAGHLDTVRSSRATRTYEMTLVIAGEPPSPSFGSPEALRALYETNEPLWFQPPVETNTGEPVQAFLLGNLEEDPWGPLHHGSGAYHLISVEIGLA